MDGKWQLKQYRIHLLLAAALVIFILLNYRWLELSTLQLYSKDDFGFYRVLRKMYLALGAADIKTLFQYNYYNYGFSYFLLNEVICYPFLAGGNTAMVIFLPRMVSAIAALVSALYLYKTARLYLDENRSLLLVLFSMSLPAFWKIGIFFHPDWLMGCFITIATYHFAKDQHTFGKHFRLAVIFLGIATGIKFQALVYLPLLLAIIFYDEITRADFSHFRSSVRRGLASLLAIVAIFLLNNPYMLHPKGFAAFVTALDRNMVSNATNHFSYVDLTLADKLQVLDANYMNYVFLALLALANIFEVVRTLLKKEKEFFFTTSLAACVILLYLLLVVNKAWTHYYLAAVLTAMLVIIPLLRQLKVATGIYLLAFACLVQALYYTGKYSDLFSMSKDIEDYDIDLAQAEENFAFIRKHSAGLDEDDHILITPALPFDHQEMGIPFENVHFLNGHLHEKWLVKSVFLAENPRSTAGEFIAYDLLILRKDYIRKLGEGSPADVENRHAQELMEQLRDSAYGYVPVAENKWISIFKKENSKNER